MSETTTTDSVKEPSIKPVGNDNSLTEQDIRIWLRDTDPAANLLLDDYEFSSEEIRTALNLTVDYWNDLPPYFRTYDYDKFPFRSRLLCGVAANLLFMAAHRFRRNSLAVNAGGVSVNDQEKFQAYDAAGQRLWEEYKQWARLNKRSLNSELGWGYA